MTDHHDWSDPIQHCSCVDDVADLLQEEVGNKQEEIMDLREELSERERLIQELDDEADEYETILQEQEQTTNKLNKALNYLIVEIENRIVDGCVYKDNCPTNANHYQCDVCRFNEALKKVKEMLK